MNTTPREAYQFDLHARYSLLADILEAALPASEGTRILDVGAGPQRLTEEFLPLGFAAVTRTDVESFDDPDLVEVPSGAGLPFADGSFDAVVAMDVLEHVRPQERADFLRECLRVSARVTVIAAPIGCEAVNQAEREYAEAFKHLFEVTEPFLDEHADMGLPEPGQVLDVLRAAGVAVVSVDNVRLVDWLALNIANLYLSTVNDGDDVRTVVARMHNATIPPSYRDAQHYRRFYICTRDQTLAALLAEQFDPAALPSDGERPDAALLVMGEELKRYAMTYHGPSLDALRADQALTITTLGEVIAAKDQHITELQAVADGLADRVSGADELRRALEAERAWLESQHATLSVNVERTAALLEDYAQALKASQEALQAAQIGWARQQYRSLSILVQRIYLKIKGWVSRTGQAES